MEGEEGEGRGSRDHMITFIGSAGRVRDSVFGSMQLLQGSFETAISLAGDSLTETTGGAGEAANYLPENRAVRNSKVEDCRLGGGSPREAARKVGLHPTEPSPSTETSQQSEVPRLQRVGGNPVASWVSEAHGRLVIHAMS